MIRLWLLRRKLAALADNELYLLAELRAIRQTRERTLARIEELERRRSREITRRTIAETIRRRDVDQVRAERRRHEDGRARFLQVVKGDTE